MATDLDAAGWLGTRAAIGNKAVLYRPAEADEGLLNVDVVLGGAFKEFDAELLGELLSLLGADDLLVEHIALVAHQNLVDVDVGVLLDL